MLSTRSIVRYVPLLLTVWGASALGMIQASESPALAVITHRCLSCHSGDDAKGQLDLTTRDLMVRGGESGPALVPGKLADSAIWQRVEQDEMPPKHPLNAAEKQSLREWIESGADWQGGSLDPLAASTEHRAGLDWWSLQPLATAKIPAITTANLRQPIDSFVAERLAARQLTLSPEADRRVLIRRVTFDLIGLPPSPSEIDEFVQDERPDSLERLVDRLLASPHYGERWARHWLDVVRFGESNGFERDLPRPHAWPYRDWVIDAFNRDLPYDQFVQWQLAGDLIAPDDVEAVKAVGFLVAGAHDTVVPVVDRMRAMMRQDELEDIVGTVGQTFLGLTINCARCHDHKFDPITTREYYQLASALSGIDHGERDYVPPAATHQLEQWQARIQELERLLQDQESPIRELLLADRTGAAARQAAALPRPLAAWDFTRDLYDQVGQLNVRLVGPARRTSEGLVVDGTSYAQTSTLPRGLLEKTLEVRVRLTTLQQGGGAPLSLQTTDGQFFDAIVFGELEPGRWMAGSNGFARTASFRGTAEERADKEPVVLTQVYRADGTIVGYRNGVRYGNPIRQDAAIRFEANSSQINFGLRHGTEAGGNRTLQGIIAGAKVYDSALNDEQVAVSANASGTVVTEAEIVAQLSPEDRQLRAERQREWSTLKQRHAELQKSAPVKIYTAIATQPPPMKVHKRGSVSSLGDDVEPAGLAAVKGLAPGFGLRPDAIESHRRLHLARWITDARNPLFTRVMTNRIWHYHFGAGLVETPNDLGFHAGLPSHPELLEWLSREFQGGRLAQGGAREPQDFSIKRLHRLLVGSATYRQSSAYQAAAAQVDASNRLLWRMNPRRLEAEEIRDAMLLTAGELNPALGGKGYLDVNSYFFKGTQFYDPIDPTGYANHRRTIYRMWARGGRSPFLDTFDCPDPSTTSPRRSSTVTPLQALSLLNNSFSLRMADHLAARVTRETNATDAAIQRTFQLLFGRAADAEELGLSRDLVERRGMNTFCRAMWNSSEFLFID